MVKLYYTAIRIVSILTLAAFLLIQAGPSYAMRSQQIKGNAIDKEIANAMGAGDTQTVDELHHEAIRALDELVWAVDKMPTWRLKEELDPLLSEAIKCVRAYKAQPGAEKSSLRRWIVGIKYALIKRKELKSQQELKAQPDVKAPSIFRDEEGSVPSKPFPSAVMQPLSEQPSSQKNAKTKRKPVGKFFNDVLGRILLEEGRAVSKKTASAAYK